MSLLTILEGMVSLTNKPQDVLTSIKTEDGELISDTSQILSTLKEAFGEKFRGVADSQYKRGLREKGEEIEKFISSNFDLEKGDLKGVELINALAESLKAGQPDPNSGQDPAPIKELTEADAKENPIVLSLIKNAVREKVGEMEAKLVEKETAFESYKRDQKRREVQVKVKEKAAEVLKAIKAKLEDEEGNDTRRLNFFLGTLNPDNFSVDQEGNPYPIDPKTGQPLEDDNYNTVSFADLIKERNPFGIHKQDPGKGSPSPGTRTNGSGNGRSTGAYSFADQSELDAFLASEMDRGKRKEAIDSFYQSLEKISLPLNLNY